MPRGALVAVSDLRTTPNSTGIFNERQPGRFEATSGTKSSKGDVSVGLGIFSTHLVHLDDRLSHSLSGRWLVITARHRNPEEIKPKGRAPWPRKSGPRSGKPRSFSQPCRSWSMFSGRTARRAGLWP